MAKGTFRWNSGNAGACPKANRMDRGQGGVSRTLKGGEGSLVQTARTAQGGNERVGERSATPTRLLLCLPSAFYVCVNGPW